MHGHASVLPSDWEKAEGGSGEHLLRCFDQRWAEVFTQSTTRALVWDSCVPAVPLAGLVQHCWPWPRRQGNGRGGGGGRKGKNNTAFPTGLSVIIGQLCLCSRRGVGRDQGHPALPHPSIHPCRGWRSRAGSRRAERSGEGEHQTNTELQGWLQSWPGAGYRHLPAQHKACLSWLLPMQRGEGSELCSQSHPETPRGSWQRGCSNRVCPRGLPLAAHLLCRDPHPQPSPSSGQSQAPA